MAIVKKLALASLLCVTGLTAWSQTHYEEMTVSVKQLHVNVVDRKGNPISGLTGKDFEVMLNGKKQEVVSAIPIALEQGVAQGDGVQQSPIPEYGRRLFMFVFDVQYNNANDIIRARKYAYEFIKNDMLDNDLVSLFTLGKSQIRMVTNFTSDKVQLLEALHAFGTDRDKDAFHMDTGFYAREYWERQGSYGKSDSGISNGRDTQTGLEGLDIPQNDRFGADEQMGEILLTLEGNIRNRLTTQALGYMSNFKEFASSLSILNGRKNMVLFSSSFDGSLALGLAGERGGERAVNSSVGHAGGLVSGRMLDAAQELIDELMASGIVVFAVDTSAAGMQSQKSSLHMLNNFSASTGGRLFANARDMGKALRKIKTITSQYYLVNIRPDIRLERGELAKVKVKVDRPKVKIYTSKALMLEPDFQRLDNMERKMLLSEYVSRDIIALPIPIDMDVVRVPGPGDVSRLNALVQVEGDYFLNTSDPNLAQEFELFLLAVDRNTNRLISQHYNTFAIVPEASRDILSESGLAYFGDLGVNDGSYKIKLILRNLRNGHTASMIRDIDVKNNAIAARPLQLTQTPWLEIRKEAPDTRGSDDLIQLETSIRDDPFPFQFAENAQFLPTADKSLNTNGQATFVFLLDEAQAKAHADKLSMAAVITDGKGGNQVAPPNALRFKLFQSRGSGHPAGLVLALDMNAFKLDDGKDYTLLTRIDLGGNAPALAQFPFSASR